VLTPARRPAPHLARPQRRAAEPLRWFAAHAVAARRSRPAARAVSARPSRLAAHVASARPLAVAAGLLGWAVTLLLSVLRVRARRRLARACHEVRGPLCAARLGLGTLESDPPRLAAIDLELRRAARLLDDLSGARTADRRELVDLCSLARAHAPAWQAVAAAHGAGLRLDVIAEAPPPGGIVVPLRPRRPVRCASPLLVGPADAPRVPLVPAAAAQPPDVAPPGTAVLGDPLRLAQACANLVANAAEHGGGLVRVRVVAVGDRVRFEVADDGPGLPAPVAVLAAAGRARRSRRGHGLAVAAAVAFRHGGRLTAAPAGGGARVVLDLPVAGPLRVARRDAAAPPEIVA
jgi:signal transduction histidine kinase